MEHQENTKEERLEKMRKKYQVGQRHKGGLAYNIVNNEYEKNEDGQKLRNSEDTKEAKQVMRGNRNMFSGDGSYNPINGIEKPTIKPQQQSMLALKDRMTMLGAGNSIIKSAGKPLRSNQYRMLPGQPLSPHDAPIGRK